MCDESLHSTAHARRLRRPLLCSSGHGYRPRRRRLWLRHVGTALGEPAPPPDANECMQVLDRYIEVPWEVSTGDLNEAMNVFREFTENADAKNNDKDGDPAQ